MVGLLPAFGAPGTGRVSAPLFALALSLGAAGVAWAGAGPGGPVASAGGAVAPSAALSLPLPAGAQQTRLRLARPGVPGHWQVHWVEALPLSQVLAQWRLQHGQDLLLEVVTPGLWRLRLSQSGEMVLLHAPVQAGAADAPTRWWLSRWQSHSVPAASWQGLLELEMAPPGVQVLSDWLTDHAATVARQRVWAQAGQSPQQWAHHLGQQWQRQGWQAIGQRPSGQAGRLQVWRRQRFERSLVVVALPGGSAALITDRLVRQP